MEKRDYDNDNDISTTLIMGSTDRRLEEWDMTSYHGSCINSVEVRDSVHSLIQTKRRTVTMETKSMNKMKMKMKKSRLVCGMGGGVIEMRELNTLRLKKSFKLHTSIVSALCELSDGSFVSGADDQALLRWDEDGTVLQTLCADLNGVQRVIELNPNVFVSAADEDQTLRLWNVSSGECFCESTADCFIDGLVRLSDHRFATTTRRDRWIQVWSEQGDCINSTFGRCIRDVTSMLALRDSSLLLIGISGSISTAFSSQYYTAIEIWRLKPEDLVPEATKLRAGGGLARLCCAAIFKNKWMFDLDELSRVLPEELFWLCFGFAPVKAAIDAEQKQRRRRQRLQQQLLQQQPQSQTQSQPTQKGFLKHFMSSIWK